MAGQQSSNSDSRKRVGIWIRVSTEEQAQGESPQHHEYRARTYAESKSWAVIETYHLEGVSGKAVADHPEAKRMLQDVERGHITGLIFSKLARLGRNTKELLEFADFFQKNNADLISLQESIDTSTPAGRLFYTMIAAMAHWEREEIASRVAASIPVRARLGKQISGVAPYGYQWKDKKLIPHPEEAPIRKLAYELFLEHKRRTTVARILNERGFRMRKGRLFQRVSIECMIEDPTAKGWRRANYSKQGSGKLKPESEWVWTQCEPIVPEELWERCNAILSEQKANHKPPSRKAVQLFGGLTWCGRCGTKMYAKSNTPKYVCSKCSNRIAIVDLEDVFIEQLKGLLVSPDAIRSYLDQADQSIKEKTELIEVLETERKKLKREMDQILQLYFADKITKDGFGELYRPCEEHLAQMNEQLPRLQGEVDLLKVNLISTDELLEQARDLYGRWPELSHNEKRKIVEAITSRITIGEEEIEIELYYMPSIQNSPEDFSFTSSEPSDSTPQCTHTSKTTKPSRSKTYVFDQNHGKKRRNSVRSMLGWRGGSALSRSSSGMTAVRA